MSAQVARIARARRTSAFSSALLQPGTVRDSERKLQELFSSIPAAIYTTDA